MTNNASAITHIWEDRFGSVIEHADASYLEIRWYDTTADMSAGEFREWLSGFAVAVEQRKQPGVLVDSTRFLMDPANMSEQWRDENIIPHYNAGGVRKFAFHMPEGMPAIGSPPKPVGPAKFPTSFFARRQDALDWLASPDS